MSESISQAQIDIRARYYYLGCVLIFAIRFASSCLFSQLSQPVLISPDIDNTFWLFHWLGIPYLATHSVIWSAVLDILLFLLPIIASVVSGRRLYALLFTLLAIIYQITFSTYTKHQYHSLIGVLVLSIPFWAGPGRRFTFLWEAARYYFSFIFSSAALWKLSRGTVLDGGHMSSVLMAQHVQTIYEYPASVFAHIHSYLISHAGLARLVFLTGFVIQLSFLGGFFTKKYDRVYLVLFIAFFAMNYLVMQIFDLEIFIFLLVLLDWDKIEKKIKNPLPVTRPHTA